MIVSIVTPVLNGGPYLSQCIESVMRERKACQQNGSDIEVEHVIADGGSTDGSIELARSYHLDVTCENGTDLHDRLNRACLASRGELISFLGADDVLLAGTIEAVVDAYRRSGRRWVVGGLRWIDPDGRSLGTLRAPPGWLRPEIHACLGWNLGSPMATYYSRSIFTELGGYDPRYHISADYDLFTRALATAPYARTAHVLAGARRSGTNRSVLNKASRQEESRLILEALGPTSNAQRLANRILLKTWVNASNPDWLARKLLDRTQLALGLKNVTYFN